MSISEFFLGKDKKLDRDDPLFWISVIGIVTFLAVEVWDKFQNSVKISEMAYILLIATSLGRTALRAMFLNKVGKQNNEDPRKEESHGN